MGPKFESTNKNILNIIFFIISRTYRNMSRWILFSHRTLTSAELAMACRVLKLFFGKKNYNGPVTVFIKKYFIVGFDGCFFEIVSRNFLYTELFIHRLKFICDLYPVSILKKKKT